MTNQVKTVLIHGVFHFIGNKDSNFKGPVRRGFRPIIWLNEVTEGATSCSFISDIEVYEGEYKKADIVILNELQLNSPITKEVILNVGSTIHKIGEFEVLENLGEWKGGKVP